MTQETVELRASLLSGRSKDEMEPGGISTGTASEGGRAEMLL